MSTRSWSVVECESFLGGCDEGSVKPFLDRCSRPDRRAPLGRTAAPPRKGPPPREGRYKNRNAGRKARTTTEARLSTPAVSDQGPALNLRWSVVLRHCSRFVFRRAETDQSRWHGATGAPRRS